MNRREFFRGTTLAGLSLFAAGGLMPRAVADPDPVPGTVYDAPAVTEPTVYPFKFGGLDAFVILDGAITMPSVQPAFAPDAKKSEVDEELAHCFQPTDHLALSINVLAIKTSSGVLLFDAGAGQAFGSIGGKLVRGLAAAGIKPEDVKTIYLTHAHPDHIAGLVGADDQLLFPSAKAIIPKTEVNFWTQPSPDVSGMRGTPEMIKGVVAGSKKYLAAAKSQIELRDEGKLSPEVEMIAAHGHTPGHVIYSVTIGGDRLIVLGDSVHVFSLQFAHPEWAMAYDTDPKLAIKTRRHIFEEAVAQRQLLLGYHLPFPGLGHVRKVAHGFEWVPKPWVG